MYKYTKRLNSCNGTAFYNDFDCCGDERRG